MKKILITDDDKGIRDALEFILKDEGYETMVVSNGLAAYLRSNIWKPDLILMDILLPNISGLQAAKDIKEVGIPIIFMTGSDVKNIEEEALKFNPVAFLKKPLDIPRLLEIIKDYFTDY